MTIMTNVCCSKRNIEQIKMMRTNTTKGTCISMCLFVKQKHTQRRSILLPVQLYIMYMIMNENDEKKRRRRFDLTKTEYNHYSQTTFRRRRKERDYTRTQKYKEMRNQQVTSQRVAFLSPEPVKIYRSSAEMSQHRTLDDSFD